MKKLMLAALVLFSVACGEKEKETPKTPAELLIGMWYPTTETTIFKDQAGKDSTSTFLHSDYLVLEFSNGGVVKTSDALSSKTGTWKLEGNNLVAKTTADDKELTYVLHISKEALTMSLTEEKGTTIMTMLRTSAADMKSQPLMGEWKIMTAQAVDPKTGEVTGEPMDLSTANIIAKFLKNGYFGDSMGAIGKGTWTISDAKLKVMIPAVGEKPAVEMLAPFSIATVEGVETLTARLNVAMLGGALMEAKLVRTTAPVTPPAPEA